MKKVILKKAEWKKGEWHHVDVTDALCYVNKKRTALEYSESGKAVRLCISRKGHDSFYIWVPAKLLRGNLLSLTEGMEFRQTFYSGSMSSVTVGTVKAWELAKMLGGCVEAA